MAAVTHAGTTWNTTAGNKTVVATPAAGDLIVVIAASTGVATSAVADTNADGLGTYTKVDSTRTGFSTSGNLTVWIRDALIGNAASTTFQANQASSTGGGLSVFRVSAMTRTGALALKSSGGQSSGTSATTPAPVLGATPDTANPIIAAVCNGTNSSTTVVHRTGYTEASDLGYNTPATGFESCFLNSGETSATLTFGGTSATAFASVAIELDTTPVPGPTITVFEVSSYTTTTTPKTITVTGGVTGDLIVVCMGGDTFNNSPTAASVTTTSGSTSAWAEQEERFNASDQVWQNISTATLTADGSVTVSLARTQGTAQVWGGYAALCHDHGGVGNHTWLAPGATDSVSLTTSQDSAVFGIGVDWDHQAVVAFTPAGAVDVERNAGLTSVTWYAGYWPVQPAGSRSYGTVTNAASTVFGLALVEVLAATGGATVNGAADGAFGFTATSAGVDRALGTAAASFGFTGSAQGVDRALGAAVASLGFTAAASGVAGTPPVTGVASGLFGFTATALGIPRTRGVATASFGFTATVAGVDRSIGAALASLGFTGSASGIDRAVGIAAGIFGFAAVVIGVPDVHGTAVGSFGFTGAGQGFAGTPPVTGAATGLFGFTATTQGQPRTPGVAATAFGFTATAGGHPRVISTVVASFGFTGSAAGTPRVLGLAQATFTFTAVANGQGATVSAYSVAVVVDTRSGTAGIAARRTSITGVSGQTSAATVTERTTSN